MKIVIIQSHNGGRLANQLWNYISIYAYCVDKKYLLINPTFEPYAKYFHYLENNSLHSPSLRMKGYLGKNWGHILSSFLLKVNSRIKIANVLHTGHEDNAIILPPTNNAFQARYPVLFLNGWLFRNTLGLDKHGDTVREKFKPAKQYRDAIDSFLLDIPRDKLKIAVHMRRTDYKDHLNGKYFYEVNDYLNGMKKLREEFKDNNVIFVIFSDEKRDKAEFNGINEDELMISNNEFIVDLFLLAKMDLIIGPPSTFSQFASWYGNVKLRVIEAVEDFTK